jgi:segregation and condensation protein B
MDLRSERLTAIGARVEAVLFVAPGPVEVGQLAASLNVSPKEVEASLDLLSERYEQGGLSLQRHRGRVQLTSSPQFAPDIEHFLELETTTRLTKAALEVLAVIAYQQPTTRPQIDDVRGVNSETVLHTLLRYGLIEEIGRSDAPGRPILYATTPEFLHYFGLQSLEDLPPLDPEATLELASPQPESSADQADDA